MNKHYFIETSKGKDGPFTFEELSTMKLLDTTKAWHEGLDTWVNIYDLEELKPIVIKSPPPTQKEKEIIVKENKLSYFKENLGLYLTVSFFVGIGLNIVITWTALQPDAAEGNFPIYTSYGERQEPFMKLFLPLLPYSLLAVFVISIIILALKSLILNANDHKVNSDDPERNNTTSIKYLYTETLDGYKQLQYLAVPAYNGKDKVLIDGQIPNDGYFYAPHINKIFYIKDSIVVNEYLREWFKIKGVGVLDIYSNYQTASKKGAPAFISGKPAPDGIYKLGLFSTITVKDGIVV